MSRGTILIADDDGAIRTVHNWKNSSKHVNNTSAFVKGDAFKVPHTRVYWKYVSS